MNDQELQQQIEQVAAQLNDLTSSARQEQAQLFYEQPRKRPSLQKMQASVWVNSQEPIAWPNWPPGLKAKAIALGKKVMRRSLQWYIDPIVQQQNEFNDATLRAVTELAREIAALDRCDPVIAEVEFFKRR